MIHIDNISFRFTAHREPFVHQLYAKWDDFCCYSIEQVLDDVLFPFDSDKAELTIDRLDLHLGTIPEDDFYRLFPVRLREELLRVMQLQQDSDIIRKPNMKKQELRISNILHYLTYGFCLSEWEDTDFYLQSELKYMLENNPEELTTLIRQGFHEQVLLERIILHVDKDFLWRIFSLLLKSTDINQYEKQFMFSSLDEIYPDLIHQFFKKTDADNPTLSKLINHPDWKSITKDATNHSEWTNSPNKIPQQWQWLQDNNIPVNEKRDKLLYSLESDPSNVINFICVTADSNTLHLLARLLNDRIAAQLINAIGKHQNKKDLTAAYWHYFHQWLTTNYDKISVAFPGDKEEFHKQLSATLLQCIKQQERSSVFSEKDFTIFLLKELAGEDRYAVFLTALYKYRSLLTSPADHIIQQLWENLSLESSAEEQTITTSPTPETAMIPNAGLVLLTPWFPRLFSMLGLLNEDGNDFKDLESRVRAIFIIQRMVTFENRDYREQDLTFNRILVNCPFRIALPKQMALNKEEIEIIDSMLTGVKANWSKMVNTSLLSFQQSFIERNGWLKQQEEQWLLTVEPRAYDILLDSLPWGYQLVRFPWLEKKIHVNWR